MSTREPTVTPTQFDAARRVPWLRAAYYHADVVAHTLADLGSDTTITITPDAGIDPPDALLGGGLAIDVVPDTQACVDAHLARSYIASREQLVTYEPPTREFLAEIFER